MTNRMPLSLRTLVLTVFVSCGLAQNQGVVPKLISNSLPACGQSCEILIKAQAACVPPAAPVSDPTIYQSCFCQSAFLTTLLTGGPNSLCPACSPAEMGTIETWFQASCAPPDQTPPDQAPAPPAAQPDDPAPAPPAGAAPTKAPDATKGGATISEKPPPNNKGWFSNHWRWVLMLIILILGFSLLAWLGSFFHRRHHRRRDAEAIGSQPDLRTWRPGQSAHEIANLDMAPPPPAPLLSEKEKETKQPRKFSTAASRRLTKSWLRRSRGDL